MRRPLLALASLLVAPVLMAPGQEGCRSCQQQSFRDVLVRESAYHEVEVERGVRYAVRLSVLEGTARAQLLPWGAGASLRDLRCRQGADHAECDFESAYEGALGVLVEPAAQSAEVVLDFEPLE